MVGQLEEAETRLASTTKQVTSLEGQLADSQELAGEETRKKLSTLSQLRQAEEHVSQLEEQFDEEEEARKALELKANNYSMQVRSGG